MTGSNQQSGGKDGYSGQQGLSDVASEYNRLTFLAEQLQNLMSTATIVKVLKVTNDGGVSPIGSVDVQPMVNLLDGVGNSGKHGTVLEVPYCRVQGGKDAVIMDPKVGDLGLCVFADRDITKVVSTKAQANPGSRRRFDMADGMYVFTIATDGPPERWIRFFVGGIEAVAKDGSNKLLLRDDGSARLEGTVVQVHATQTATIDANGTGFVIKANGAIDSYSSSGDHHDPSPPEVPT